MKKAIVTLALAVGALAACGGTSQTQNCKNYLACEQALGVAPDGGSISNADNDTFGPSGTCWLSSAAASVCDSQCVSQLHDLESVPGFSSIPACANAADAGH